MGRFLENCSPGRYVENIAQIDLDELKSNGIEGLLIDLDNTLLPWKDSAIPPASREWVSRAKSLGMKLCIVSNTHYPKRLNKIASELEIASIPRALKPRPYGFNKAIEMLGLEKANCAAIGDQVLTDILGGNRAGVYTILVKPMHRVEFFGTKISRVIEWIILTLLRRLGKTGTKSEMGKSEEQEPR